MMAVIERVLIGVRMLVLKLYDFPVLPVTESCKGFANDVGYLGFCSFVNSKRMLFYCRNAEHFLLLHDVLVSFSIAYRKIFVLQSSSEERNLPFPVRKCI